MLLLLLLGGCTTTLHPLYRDYRPEIALPRDTLLVHVAHRLKDVGWQPDLPPVPGTYRSRKRTVGHWGLYRVVAYLEVVPMKDRLRVFVHPYRHYLVGGRRKIPFLSGALEAALIPPLDRALRTAGLKPLEVPVLREGY